MSFLLQAPAPSGRDALRQIRVEAIFATLLAKSPLARTELAALTGYSPSTVTGIIHDLSEAGYVRVVGQVESNGGRPRTLIEFDRTSITIAVVGVRANRVWAQLVDLNATLIDSVERDFNAEQPLIDATAAIAELTARAKLPPSRVVLSLPGVVGRDGSATLAPAFGAVSHIVLADALAELVLLPVTVENDVNLIALGERQAGAGNGVDDLAVIHIEEGIGATIVIGARVLDGSSRSAGEIGFLPYGPESAHRSERGEFEARWGTGGIELQARERGHALDPGNPIADLCSRTDAPAVALLHEAVSAWAYAAVVCVCVTNPQRVIFSGDAVHLDEPARTLLIERVLTGVPSPTDVKFATLGERSMLHGAVATVLTKAADLLSSALSAAPSRGELQR
ncbi:ROK family transcriptional regulator [Cryobacterium aureum]|uniref:ROK family transcriptional regulator n=1 Tax=Cryobacterium aureum TaxID=995037 RepID=UPI000CF54BB1|nr:ROK family transcriptional regulator [Cryobacterium aureum]